MARQFDGSNQYASASLDLSGTNYLSIAFWLWWDSFANDNDFAMEFTADVGSNNGFAINPNHALGEWQFATNLSGSTNVSLKRIARPSAAAWHHFVCEIDGRDNPDSYTIFLNGVSQSFTASSNFDGTGNFANSTLYLFSRAGSTFFGAGRMAELAIYPSYIINTAEAEAMADGVHPLLIRPDAKPYYWPLHGRYSPETEWWHRADATLFNTPTAVEHPRVHYWNIPFASPSPTTVSVPGTASLTITTYAPTVTGSTVFTTSKLIEVDWNDDGDFSDTGEDVTARVDGDAGIVWSRGKDQIRQFAPGAAGQLGFLLNNYSKDYSPGNGSSPIAGLVTPGKAVRISSTSPGRVLWKGITDEINQFPHFMERNVGFNCLGNLSKLRGKYVSTALYSNILTSTFLGHILDAAGWPAADRNIQTGMTTLLWAWADKQDAFDLVMRITRTEGPRASCYEDPNGKLVFENREARITQTRSTTSQQTFTGTTNIANLDYNPNYKDVIEACVIQVDEREIQGQSVIWELGSTLTLGNAEVWRREIRSVSGDPFMDLVIPSPAPSDTVQTLTADATLTAGTFKLRFREVTAASAIDWDSTAAEIQTSLESLSTIGSGDVSCAGGPINTTPVVVTFIGTFAGQAITDLIEVVDSTLNPVSAPASITVTEDLAGTGILATRQSLRPSTALTGGGPYNITVDLSPDPGGGTTGDIAYNASSSTVQTALRALSNCNLFNVTGGPMSDGIPFQVIMITGSAADYELMTIGGTAVTGSVPSATINTAITVQGGVPDYVVIAGAVTFSLSRTSGANAMLTATAGASGATITGLRVRGRLVSVVRSHQTSFPEDVTDIPVGKIVRPDTFPEISLDYGAEYAELFVDHYSVVRPTVVLTIVSSLFNPSNDNLYAREISDRISIVETQTGINDDAHIEQIRQSIIGLVLTTEIGCELIP